MESDFTLVNNTLGMMYTRHLCFASQFVTRTQKKVKVHSVQIGLNHADYSLMSISGRCGIKY